MMRLGWEGEEAMNGIVRANNDCMFIDENAV